MHFFNIEGFVLYFKILFNLFLITYDDEKKNKLFIVILD